MAEAQVMNGDANETRHNSRVIFNFTPIKAKSSQDLNVSPKVATFAQVSPSPVNSPVPEILQETAVADVS